MLVVFGFDSYLHILQISTLSKRVSMILRPLFDVTIANTRRDSEHIKGSWNAPLETLVQEQRQEGELEHTLELQECQKFLIIRYL